MSSRQEKKSRVHEGRAKRALALAAALVQYSSGEIVWQNCSAGLDGEQITDLAAALVARLMLLTSEFSLYLSSSLPEHSMAWACFQEHEQDLGSVQHGCRARIASGKRKRAGKATASRYRTVPYSIALV
ncbi:hypothetical protein BCV70DRAFT_53576 [Testicularia cyperi]|uniref:Uncharacterized protein n=1 Tax=Testicularia cyperi TaxID=1882483 RepID=A0A317XV38_9BASI|nr:hypothetical protein BCV70DRAFT_53576 [Testicularia cyperi]